jgi:hypothetical protein
MVVDGRIKIHSCEKGVKEIQQDAIVLENGSQVRADIIVLATGYHSNVETVEKILGSEVAQKLDSNFGRMDSENERAGVSTDAHRPHLSCYVYATQLSHPSSICTIRA